MRRNKMLAMLILAGLILAQAVPVMANPVVVDANYILMLYRKNVAQIEDMLQSDEPIATLYTDAVVNLRSGSSTDSEVLTIIDWGEELEQRREVDAEGWCQVSYEGETGYVRYEYLTDTNPWDRLEYLGNYYITGYRMFDAAENGGRSDGLTASGVVGTPGHTVAMKGIPFGTRIYIDGLGFFVVEDRGVGYDCVDVAVDTIAEAYNITGYKDVYILE